MLRYKCGEYNNGKNSQWENKRDNAASSLLSEIWFFRYNVGLIFSL